MVSYKDKEKAFYDKNQTRLTFNGCKENDFFGARDEKIIKYSDNVTCPFCLNYTLFSNFTKVDMGLFECPTCKTNMRKRTVILSLATTEEIEEFAEWVFEYRKNGFWQKVKPDFKTWCEKLFLLRVSLEFWNRYKELRGDEHDDEID